MNARIFTIFASVALLLGLVRPGACQGWDPELVDRFAHVAAQEGGSGTGRIKPIETVATWMLTRHNGKRSVRVGDRTLSSVEWLLDVLFYPEKAKKYESFLIENDEVLDALALGHEGKGKRDRYSYESLVPARARLDTAASAAMRVKQEDRSPVQFQTLRLWQAVGEFEYMLRYFDAAREKGSAPPESSLTDVAIVPIPKDATSARFWLTPDEVGMPLPASFGDLTSQKAAVAQWAKFIAVRDDPAAARGAFLAACDSLRALGEARRELGKIDLEVTYYRLDLVYKALYAFGIAFLMCAFLWLRPRLTKLRWATFGMTCVAELTLISAIVLRCILRSRPPVSTLYETILFITAVLVLLTLVIEFVQRRGLMLSVGAVMGFAGMYLANRYETGESTGGTDTMPNLVAVLDTNFWLAVHVTTVTIGYSAGLLAAGIAHVYLFAKLFGARSGDRDFYRLMSRAVYGVICFGLLFSVFGTITGGVWANESWGRFWGWDPKENGALLICLGEIAILHGRMGGYLREHGICMAAVLNGVVVSASWWGVNLLGVGLHSYGFTSGVGALLLGFWGTQALVLLVGYLGWRLHRKAATAPSPAKGTETSGVDALPEPVR
jgi:ABC-type transport system involved in cytochrome c biogenesis permease subunit